MEPGVAMASVDLHPAIEATKDLVPIPDIDESVLPVLRETPLTAPVELSDAVERHDHVISQDPNVVVRVHRPKGAKGVLPCVYSIHGGGYVLGSYDMDDAQFDVWCPALRHRRRVRRVPPGAGDAVPGAARGLLRRAEVDLRPRRRARHRPEPDRHRRASAPVAGWPRRWPCSPATAGEVPVRSSCSTARCSTTGRRTASSQLEGLAVWSRESNTFGWRSYLGDLYGTDDVPSTRHRPAPPTWPACRPAYVCVGGVDGFRDEDIDYAMRLNQAGVPTELHVYPGAPHGVALWAESDIAQRYNRDQQDWLGRQLARLTG